MVNSNQPCGKFIRRIKPQGQGYNITCQNTATEKIVAIGPDGQEIGHGYYCVHHVQSAANSYASAAGWKLEIRSQTNNH